MSAPQVELTSTDLSDLDPTVALNQNAESAPVNGSANKASAQQTAVDAKNSILECMVSVTNAFGIAEPS
jgi:hypothetical protein